MAAIWPPEVEGCGLGYFSFSVRSASLHCTLRGGRGHACRDPSTSKVSLCAGSPDEVSFYLSSAQLLAQLYTLFTSAVRGKRCLVSHAPRRCLVVRCRRGDNGVSIRRLHRCRGSAWRLGSVKPVQCRPLELCTAAGAPSLASGTLSMLVGAPTASSLRQPRSVCALGAWHDRRLIYRSTLGPSFTAAQPAAGPSTAHSRAAPPLAR